MLRTSYHEIVDSAEAGLRSRSAGMTIRSFLLCRRFSARRLLKCAALAVVVWFGVALLHDGDTHHICQGHHKKYAEATVLGGSRMVQQEEQNGSTPQAPSRHDGIVGNLIANDLKLPLTSRPTVAHVMWCGKRVFKFENYLSLLSIVRVVKPLKILFHYEDPPVADGSLYHTWFEEALKQFSFIEKRELPPGACKNMTSVVRTVASCLMQTDDKDSTPSAYVADTALITRFTPFSEPTPEVTWYSRGNYVTSSLPDVILTHKPLKTSRPLGEVLKSSPKRECVAVKNGNFAHRDLLRPDLGCVVLEDSFIPQDFVELDTDFGAYVRWLYYGGPDLRVAKPSPTWVVPRIAHYVWMEQQEIQFSHFLSILSAVYVARFDRVFIHANVQPSGKYWNLLVANANITLIRIHPPETVFQQKVAVISHKSDILRLQILLQYGGAYSDRDAYWVREPDDKLMTYDSVACYDWPLQYWPQVFNIGVLVARRGAAYIRRLLETMQDYRDNDWGYNAIMMPYRVYELLPDSLHIDTHLQVICFSGICHPTWEPTFKRPMESKEKTQDFDWRTEPYAIHVTWPKPTESFISPEALKNGTDMMADIGRHILKQAGMTIADVLR